MFDFLFPVALFLGPFAFAILLHVEAGRTTQSLWPRFTSLLMMLPAAWGVYMWVITVWFLLPGQVLAEDGRLRALWIAKVVAVLVVASIYLPIALKRRKQFMACN